MRKVRLIEFNLHKITWIENGQSRNQTQIYRLPKPMLLPPYHMAFLRPWDVIHHASYGVSYVTS